MTYLCNIANKYGTDKVQHGYTLYYNDLFNNDKDKNLNFLELGIFKGASILMWNEYFKNSSIYCIDNCIPEKYSNNLICPPTIIDKLNNFSNRIKAYNCDQTDEKKINNIFNNIVFDYIVDDASHFQEESLKSLGILFKKLKSGSFYIIEDVQVMWSFLTGSWWGQKNGKEHSNAGKNLWLEKYRKTGELEDESLFNDTIIYVLNKFIETNVFYSEYLNEEDNKYLTENISKIEIIAAPQKRQEFIHDLGVPKYPGTPNTKLKSGCIAIIYKK